MGWLDTIGKIAGAVSPAVGIYNTVSGLLGAGKNQKKSDAASDGINALDAQLARQYEAFLPAYQQAVSLAQNPAYSGIPSPYNEASTELGFRPYADDINAQAQAQIDANNYAAAQSGLRYSSGTDTGNSIIRRNAASDTGQLRATMRYQEGVSRYNDAKSAEDARIARLQALMPGALNMAGQLAQNIGGQASIYGNKANQYAQSAAGGVAAMTAAGNSRTGTNQKGTNVQIPNANAGGVNSNANANMTGNPYDNTGSQYSDINGNTYGGSDLYSAVTSGLGNDRKRYA